MPLGEGALGTAHLRIIAIIFFSDRPGLAQRGPRTWHELKIWDSKPLKRWGLIQYLSTCTMFPPKDWQGPILSMWLEPSGVDDLEGNPNLTFRGNPDITFGGGNVSNPLVGGIQLISGSVIVQFHG